MQSYLYPDAVISVTQRSLHMNKFYVIIYHPSRFGGIPHDFLTTLYQILHIIVEKLAIDGIRP